MKGEGAKHPDSAFADPEKRANISGDHQSVFDGNNDSNTGHYLFDY
jgi:hypothetical protein